MVLSNLWGMINQIPLPVWLRVLLYRMWAFVYSVNLDEVPYPLESFSTLRDFFSRPMKEGCRSIADDSFVKCRLALCIRFSLF
jgi:phosphatidylserine decarboxylase